jgi:hypothetical protein
VDIRTSSTVCGMTNPVGPELADEDYARVTISLDLHFIKADLDQGWEGKLEELAASCRAALNEVIGDDGGAYQPNTVWTNKCL